MAGAAHVGGPAAFERPRGPHLVAPVIGLAGARLDQLLEHVVEAFVLEVALLLGHPLLQTKVRLDDEFAHGGPPVWWLFWVTTRDQQQFCMTFGLAPCSATRRARIIFTWSSIRRRAPAASRISIRAASSLCSSRMRRATFGVSVGFCAGHDTCWSEMNCTTSTRLCDASATAR